MKQEEEKNGRTYNKRLRRLLVLVTSREGGEESKEGKHK